MIQVHKKFDLIFFRTFTYLMVKLCSFLIELSIFCKKSAPLHGSTERIHMKAFQKFNVILIFLIKIVSYIASHFIVEIRN